MDKIDHIAIQTDSIKESINWYKMMFDCDVEFEDSTWALIKFENTKLALVIPDQHPPHIAIKRKNLEKYGSPSSIVMGPSLCMLILLMKTPLN